MGRNTTIGIKFNTRIKYYLLKERVENTLGKNLTDDDFLRLLIEAYELRGVETSLLLNLSEELRKVAEKIKDVGAKSFDYEEELRKVREKYEGEITRLKKELAELKSKKKIVYNLKTDFSSVQEFIDFLLRFVSTVALENKDLRDFANELLDILEVMKDNPNKVYDLKTILRDVNRRKDVTSQRGLGLY